MSLVGAGALAKHIDKGIPLATHSKVQKANKTLEKVKQFKVPTNVRVYAERPVTPEGFTFGIPTVRVDVEKTAVKDLGIVKMVSSGKGIKGTGKSSNKNPLPSWLKERWEAGNNFNKENRPRYPYNEVELEAKEAGGKKYVVDSYSPNKEIVSRKYTQLSDVQEKTALSYLNEITKNILQGLKYQMVLLIQKLLKADD